jgi:hypothetical protein
MVSLTSLGPLQQVEGQNGTRGGSGCSAVQQDYSPVARVGGRVTAVYDA